MNIKNFKDDSSKIYWLSFMLKPVDEDLKRYEHYKLSNLDVVDKDERLEMEVLLLLESLGYPKSDIGIFYFKDLIVKACKSLIEENQPENLISLLNNKFSQFYFDVARNDNDIGIKSFCSIVYSSLSRRDNTVANDKLLFEIFDQMPEEYNLGQNVFLIASFMANNFKGLDNPINKEKIYIK